MKYQSENATVDKRRLFILARIIRRAKTWCKWENRGIDGRMDW
jgi:hypothetical protein